MIVTVRHLKHGVFTMTVTGAKHRPDFTTVFDTMNGVWTAARGVGEAEQDRRVQDGKGWGK